MKLSRVEIKGFKSIAKKTALVVAGGVTCIAGPNGCGKSNIIDAVRWALGEQSSKSLRATAMNEVIFSGTHEVGPSSLASVTLEFVKDGGHFPKTLEGFDQVSITRRLFRSGESEYLINNVKCRLKDITDLFLDTGLHRNGYAIIEQGKVKDIIQSRPEEIRYLIEEAAEVGKFRVKRTEALRRLEATSRNLERINDLLGEVTRQRNDLRSQANKARKYQELRKEVNEISRILSTCELKEIATLKGAQEAELKDVDAGLGHVETQRAGLVEKMGAYEAECTRMKTEMESLTSRLSATESKQLLAKQEIEASEARLKDITSTMCMLTQNVEDSRKSIDEEEVKTANLKQEQRGLTSEIEVIQAHIAQLQAGHDNLVREYDALEREYNEKRTGLFETIGDVRSLEQHIIEIQDRHKEVTSTIKKRQQDLSASSESAETLSRELKNIEMEISRRNDDMPPLRHQIDDKTAEINNAKSRIEGCTQTLIDLEKTHAEILAKLSVLGRILDAESSPAKGPDTGTLNGAKKVSDLLSVQAGFETAVGRSMGTALDYLIFRDHEEILSLKEFETKSPGFVIERPHIDNHVQGPPPGSSGVLGHLKDFIKTHDGYADLVHALSQNMWVVEGLDTAIKLWRQGQRSCSFVTMDGMILEPTGVIRTTQEHTKYADVLKAKAEMKELGERRHTTQADMEQQQRLLRQAKQELFDLTAEHDNACASLSFLEREIAAFVEKKGRILDQKDRILDQQRTYEAELAQTNDLAARLDTQAASCAQQKVTLEGERMKREEALREIDERKNASRLELTTMQTQMQITRERLNDLKVIFAEKAAAINALEEAFDKRRQAIIKDQSRVDELKETRFSVEQVRLVAEQEMEDLQTSIESLKISYAALMPEYEKKLGLLRAAQEEDRILRNTIDEMEKMRSEVLLKRKEFEIAYAMNLERMEGRFGQGIPEIPDVFDAGQARQRVGELEGRIEKMGQINFASLEAFEQAQKRWEDLHRQYEDIIHASTRLKEVISSIERQSIKAFTATFVKVKENFQEIFTAMFGGGKADLVLAEGDEIEAGIEIFASPPFKRLKAMSLLSEGEKTLCAISFIFALFKVNPSPFCILDEVDAPLDDANVIRLNRLIKSFSDDSQFLIVTHNRYTMETADILYGVTFDVPGISKVVSMVLEGSQG